MYSIFFRIIVSSIIKSRIFYLIFACLVILLIINSQVGQRNKNSFQTGFNLPAITHYGYDFRNTKSGDVDKNLAEIKNMRGTIVRVMPANNKISNLDAANRLDLFLTKAERYNISVIISLTNFYKPVNPDTSAAIPTGSEQYYTIPFEGTLVLNDYFYVENSPGFLSYINFVNEIVSKNKHHKNIYAWEIGNELKYTDPKNYSVFVKFINSVARRIKTLDPNNSVATGFISADNLGLHDVNSVYNFYSEIKKDIDIVTLHQYNGSRTGNPDIDWAIANGKRAIVEEIGIGNALYKTNKFASELKNVKRHEFLKEEILYWKSKKAVAVLQWGFIAKTITDKGKPRDNGDGDENYGMDMAFPHHAKDYNDYFNLFKSL